MIGACLCTVHQPPPRISDRDALGPMLGGVHVCSLVPLAPFNTLTHRGGLQPRFTRPAPNTPGFDRQCAPHGGTGGGADTRADMGLLAGEQRPLLTRC